MSGTNGTPTRRPPAGERRRPEEEGAEGVGARLDPTADLRDDAAEEAVLARMLHLDGGAEAIDEAARQLHPSSFTSGPRAALFGAMLYLRSRGVEVNLVTLGHELKRRNELERIGPDELARLGDPDRVPSGAGVEHHAAIVAELAERRQLFREAERVKQQAASRAVPLASIDLDLLRTTSSATPSIAFRSVEDLQADGGSGVEFLVENLVASGAITLVVAKPKAGKSTFAYAMLGAMERGEPFAGRRVAQSSAVVLSEEDGATVGQKARRFGITRARFLTRRDLARSGDFAAVVAIAVEEAKLVGAGVLVIDPLAMWAGFGPDQEKDAGATTKAMRPLLAAAADGLAVVVVHHSRKGDALEGDGVRGSSAIFASVETLIELRRVDPKSRGSTARELVITSRFENIPPELLVDLHGDRFVSMDRPIDSRDETPGNRFLTLRNRILKELEGAAPSLLTRAEVRKRVQKRQEDVNEALDDLARTGAVICEGDGHAGNRQRFGARPERPESPSNGSRFPPYGGEGIAEPMGDGPSIPGSRNGLESRNRLDAAQVDPRESAP